MYRKCLISLAVLATASFVAAQSVPEDLMVQRVTGAPIGTDAEASRDIALADVDGDGDLDIFVANQGNQNNALYLNDGLGQFSRSGSSPVGTDGGNSFDAEFGDIDGDGDLDLFVVNRGSQPNFLYVNQGGSQGGTEGMFARNTTDIVANEPGSSRGAAFGDIDGDGDLDLFVANTGDEDNWLYVNQGGTQGGTEGTFEKVTAGPVVTDGGISHDGVWGDVDGDGDLDLFVPNGGGVIGGPGAVNFFYKNNGNGSFHGVPVGPVATDVGNSKCAGFADIDGDGDLDLFVGNNQGEVNTLYLNRGNGTFQRATSGPVIQNAYETEGCRWQDMDSDGDMDLFVTNQGGQPNELFFNDGSGNFSPQVLPPITSDTGASQGVDAGDLDGDGLADIVVANLNEPNHVYRNEGPQWRDHGAALPGTPGTPTLSTQGNFLSGQLQVFTTENAQPSETIFHVIGFSELSAPFMGGTLVPMPDMVFDLKTSPSGTSVVGGTLPGSLPSGFVVWYQAWIVDPGAVGGFAATNAVSVTAP